MRGYHAGMIVYCCQDLIFATKIHSTAEALGWVSRPARDATALRNRLDRIDDGKPNGEVSAVLVDMTMGEAAAGLIELARSHDAAMPIIAFAPHVEIDLLEAARRCGADRVMTRGAFSDQLPDLLNEVSKQTKHTPGSPNPQGLNT